MPVRFLLTFVPICAGGLYLLTHESGNVPITLFPGLQAPLAVVVLCSALIGALGTGLSDVPSRLVNHWWQARKLRDARKRQEAETLYQAGLAALSAGDDPRARRSLRQARPPRRPSRIRKPSAPPWKPGGRLRLSPQGRPDRE